MKDDIKKIAELLEKSNALIIGRMICMLPASARVEMIEDEGDCYTVLDMMSIDRLMYILDGFDIDGEGVVAEENRRAFEEEMKKLDGQDIRGIAIEYDMKRDMYALRIISRRVSDGH